PAPSGGGGALIWSGYQNRQLDSGQFDAQLLVEVPFTLAASATVSIHIGFSFGTIRSSMSLYTFAWAIDGDEVALPEIHVATPVLHTATTPPAGAHDVEASLTTPALNLFYGQLSIVVIAGDDNGTNSVTYV